MSHYCVLTTKTRNTCLPVYCFLFSKEEGFSIVYSNRIKQKIALLFMFFSNNTQVFFFFNDSYLATVTDKIKKINWPYEINYDVVIIDFFL